MIADCEYWINFIFISVNCAIKSTYRLQKSNSSAKLCLMAVMWEIFLYDMRYIFDEIGSCDTIDTRNRDNEDNPNIFSLSISSLPIVWNTIVHYLTTNVNSTKALSIYTAHK